MGSKGNTSDQGLEWAGDLKSSVLPSFLSCLLKHKSSKLTQPLPGLKHRTSEEYKGGWTRGPGGVTSTAASAGSQG